MLGFFDSKDIINKALIQYKQQPGFRDYPNNFSITRYDLDIITKKVFYVQHEYYLANENCDIITEVGLFASREKAIQHVQALKLKNSPLSIANPDGFSIDDYSINECFWQEGFSSW